MKHFLFNSSTAPAHYAQEFADNVNMLSEQAGSRLRMTVHEVPDVMRGAASFTIENLDSVEASTVTTLGGDTQYSDVPHSRRVGSIVTKDVASLIDRATKMKTVVSLDGPYVRKHANALGREIDRVIINALGGSVLVEDENGSQSLSALPSGQKIAASSTGLTIKKLIEMREIMDENQVDPDIQRCCVTTAQQVSNLLNEDKISSADFNSIRALTRGEVDEYLGFKFKYVQSSLLPTDGSGNRLVYGYARTGLHLGMAGDIATIIDLAPHKRNAMQIYSDVHVGAARSDDKQVVEIACAEA